MINIIVAIDEKRGIGKNGKLPWHISEDLRHFKEITKGNAVIMGRKTFESIGKPLPDRFNIVITHNANFIAPGLEIVHSFQEALDIAKKYEIFVIGGAQIFSSAISVADKIYLTKVKGDFTCDTFFPDYSQFKSEKFVAAGEENGIKYQFLELER